MCREQEFKFVSEQNVPKPVADIRHSPQKLQPKPGVTYSKKERQANADEKARLIHGAGQ
jgi:hypothetical protein